MALNWYLGVGSQAGDNLEPQEVFWMWMTLTNVRKNVSTQLAAIPMNIPGFYRDATWIKRQCQHKKLIWICPFVHVRLQCRKDLWLILLSKWIWYTGLLNVTKAASCREGYELTPGDVPGQGEFGAAGKFSNIANTEECGQLCNKNNHCKSYKYSPIEKNCYLLRKWTPTAAVHKDYSFCALIRKSHF